MTMAKATVKGDLSTVVIEQNAGQTRKVQQYACSCGSTFRVPCVGTTKPPEVFANMARRKGWTVDKKAATCPECAKPRREEPMTTKTEKPSPSETPPRTMTTKDRRAIFRAVDDHYDEANQRYADGDDKSIAAKLGVPWAWVQKIREENFGPAGPDPEITALRKELEAFSTQIDAAELAVLEANELVDKLKTTGAKMLTRLNDLEKK